MIAGTLAFSVTVTSVLSDNHTSALAGEATSVPSVEYTTNMDVFSLAENKLTAQSLYLTSKEAHEILKKDAASILFIDVRTRAEVNFVGIADQVDANIPRMPIRQNYLLGKTGKSYQRNLNPDFISAVKRRIAKKGLGKNPPIFVICRSGKGSAYAANQLAEYGFTNVYSIVDGFEGDKDKNGKRTLNGWKNAGLPWSYNIGFDRAYWSLEEKAKIF